MRLIIAFAFVALLAVTASAAVAVGSVSSPSEFLLRGTPVPVHGVPNWLLMVGDEIATSASAASISLRDGSSVVLAVNSRARVEEINGRTAFRLVSGSMQVRTAPSGTEMQFYSNSSPVNVRPGAQMTVTTGGDRVVGRPVTPPPPGVPPPASNR